MTMDTSMFSQFVTVTFAIQDDLQRVATQIFALRLGRPDWSGISRCCRGTCDPWPAPVDGQHPLKNPIIFGFQPSQIGGAGIRTYSGALFSIFAENR